jgi:hypothetical protein
MAFPRKWPNGGDKFSNLTQPVEIDVTFTVNSANTNGLGVQSVKSNGHVRNVFMHTTQTPGSNNGYTNPNPAVGYALIQFNSNYNTYVNNCNGVIAPPTGSNISISGTSVLTVGNPYVISAVGTVPAPFFTIAPVADVSGSLAGKYLTISDVFGNNYVFYAVVSGVGLPPSLTGALNNYVAIPFSFASGSTAATVGTALATAIAAVNNTNSFTATGTTTVTVTSAAANHNLTFSPVPQAQTSGFTVSSVTYTPLVNDWQSVGLFPGFVPTVNQSFIATSTGSAKGSGTVMVPGVAQATEVNVIGDPNQLISNNNISAYGGALVLVQFLAPTSSSVTTNIPTAPTNLSVVTLTFEFDNSGVTVDGL